MFMRVVFSVTLLMAVVRGAHGVPKPPRNLARRASHRDALEVNGRGALTGQAVNRRWHLEEPLGVAKDDIGGSATRNAFLGEERFLQDASEHTNKLKELKEQEQRLRQAVDALSETDVTNLVTAGGDQPYDLDLDAARAAGKTRQTIFAAEQPFLKSISRDPDASVSIKWNRHKEKCFCGKKPAKAGENVSLVIWDCNDPAKAADMKFIVPTGAVGAEEAHGQIKWAADPTKCLYVHNGWAGNGNPVYLWQCDDTAHIQSMNFTVHTNPNCDGLSSFQYSKSPLQYPTHCVDVKNLHNANDSPLELWDCVGGNNLWVIG